MQETVGAGILLFGLVLLLVGLGWLVVRAFATSLIWGVASILTFPIGVLVFGLFHFRPSRKPLALVLLGLLLGALPFGYSRAYELVYGLGERERLIDGERHLVLTGWDRQGYDILKTKTDVVVLELGNKDVTDETLDLLTAMPRLRELTLNDSSITDKGLVKLAGLASLESLRLARTAVSREGIAKFLESPPSKLKEIDVSGTGIPVSTLRKWKNGDPENRRYVN